MSLEAKDLLEYMGLKPDEVSTIDDFKAKIDTSFVRRDQVIKDKELVSQITGKVVGSATTTLNSVAKDLGIEITEDDIKGKKLEDVIRTVGNKAKDFYSTKITELETLASSTDKEAIVKEYQTKINKLEQKYNDTNKLLDTTKQDYEGKIQGYENEKKQFKVNHLKSEAIKAVQFKDGLTELERKGFLATIEEEYDVDFDETGNPYPVDKKTKSRVPNPKVTGTFMELPDIYNHKAIELKLAKVVAGNTQKQIYVPPTTKVVEPVAGTKTRIPAKDRPGFKSMT